MRRSLAWFTIGFAAGVTVLALALWFSGGIRTAGTSTAAGSRVYAPAASEADRSAPDPSAPDAPQPAPPEPVEPPALQPLIPVEGVLPKDLVDTYGQARAEGRAHDAIDIMAARGTPVLAAVEGSVVKLFNSKDGGLAVYQFDKAREWCYYYAHLDRYEPGLREGMLLRRGDRLGYVGSTGNASPEGPHLHFAIYRLGPEKRWWEGIPINPYPLLADRQ